MPWVPDFARGYVKDIRVRWALKEAGIPYAVVFVDGVARDAAPYRGWQPFGQVPGYRDGEVALFETGAILLHLAAKHEALAPQDPQGQAAVSSWVLAALSTLEPYVQYRVHFGRGADEALRATINEKLQNRLKAIATCLGDQDFLLGRFTAVDVMTGSVLRELVGTKLFAEFPTLIAYKDRCEARPAFQQALAEQLADYDRFAAEARA